MDAAHHRWQRSILNIFWKDKITNEEVKARTKQYSIASILSERRLRWLGHVLRMDHQRNPQQALHWEVQGLKREPDRPRTNWRDIIKKHLQRKRLRWQLSTDRMPSASAQYVHMNVE